MHTQHHMAAWCGTPALGCWHAFAGALRSHSYHHVLTLIRYELTDLGIRPVGVCISPWRAGNYFREQVLSAVLDHSAYLSLIN